MVSETKGFYRKFLHINWGFNMVQPTNIVWDHFGKPAGLVAIYIYINCLFEMMWDIFYMPIYIPVACHVVCTQFPVEDLCVCVTYILLCSLINITCI